MTITQNGESHLTGALAGLRVLDFSTTIAGPHCARMLADLGAEVIKIEAADGDTMRTRPPVRNGCSTAFGQLNVGKKSVVLDLKSEGGKEVVRRLAAHADIVVEKSSTRSPASAPVKWLSPFCVMVISNSPWAQSFLSWRNEQRP